LPAINGPPVVRPAALTETARETVMNSIIYLVGLIVVVLAILSLVGLA
jgi:hypothetical protein